MNSHFKYLFLKQSISSFPDRNNFLLIYLYAKLKQQQQQQQQKGHLLNFLNFILISFQNLLKLT